MSRNRWSDDIFTPKMSKVNFPVTSESLFNTITQEQSRRLWLYILKRPVGPLILTSMRLTHSYTLTEHKCSPLMINANKRQMLLFELFPFGKCKRTGTFVVIWIWRITNDIPSQQYKWDVLHLWMKVLLFNNGAEMSVLPPPAVKEKEDLHPDVESQGMNDDTLCEYRWAELPLYRGKLQRQKCVLGKLPFFFISEKCIVL